MEHFLDGRVTLHGGDAREVLRGFESNSFDSIVTDPPYALVSIVKRFGKQGSAPAKGNEAFKRASAGFMGQAWDTGETAFSEEFWSECLRVLKPGGHVVAFSGTRTYHRMACAIEDAGFEIRDQLQWIYGSGFPKSHDVSKGMDKAAGVRGHDGKKFNTAGGDIVTNGGSKFRSDHPEYVKPKGITLDAQEWQGWGTALKPACEPICFARKPLIGTVAANVLAHGTGAINIDGCRVGTDDTLSFGSRQIGDGIKYNPISPERMTPGVQNAQGRWPANILHDGSDEVIAAFPDAGGGFGKRGGQRDSEYGFGGTMETVGYGDEGSAARFFYQASKDDRCDLCDANIAAWRSSTESTQTESSAGRNVPGSPPLEGEGKAHPSNIFADAAPSHLSQCHPQKPSIAAKSAPTQRLQKIVQNVSSAANLCGSCATGIAQEIVAASRSEPLGSSVSKCSIDDFKKTILLRCLASYAAGRENTDIILTTTNLRELFGCVFHAIGESIRLAKAGSGANTEPAPKRLWYSSKADANDRLGSKHPTVKPVDLMQWLCRLVTPKGGKILDPFAGTGTTAEAAFREGMFCTLIEREPAYQDDIRRRMRLVMAGPDERKRESIKAKVGDLPFGPGSLFE